MRYAACNALGQMANDFAPTLHKKFHDKVSILSIMLAVFIFCSLCGVRVDLVRRKEERVEGGEGRGRGVRSNLGYMYH